jgi:apolipoprotein N-acyltransferase
MKDIIPWSYIHVPAIDGYVSGKEYTVFDLPRGRFGATICWENIFADFVRQFTKRGADFIINITNEAWFGDTAAPYQFLSMSVMRAVENRVSVVRSANTGISCFIDPYGRVLGQVENNQHKAVFVRGYLTREIPVRTATTFYTRHGDVFVVACGLISLLIVALSVSERVKRLILP